MANRKLRQLGLSRPFSCSIGVLTAPPQVLPSFFYCCDLQNCNGVVIIQLVDDNSFLTRTLENGISSFAPFFECFI